VEKSPKKIRPRLNLGAALIRKLAFDDAMRQYATALSLDPNVPGAHNGLGFCQLNKGNLQEAERRFQRALQIDPNFTDSKTGLGVVLYHQGKFGDALSYFNQVYEKRRESTDLMRLIADSYLRIGQPDLAMEFIRRGMELSPEDPVWQEMLKEARRPR
jgi:tetratricopeptide (TPR) repeat protein